MRQGRMRRLGAAVAGAILVGAAGMVVMSAPAGAVTVSTEAELDAAWADGGVTEISLANDITLTCGGAGELDRSAATGVTVLGNGFTITQTCAFSRVMDKDVGGGVITLDDVTITGGNTTGDGAGIRALGTDLVIVDSTITGNTTTAGDGGAAFVGGPVTVTSSTISDNHAPAGQGGGVWTSSDLDITDSTFTQNTAAGEAFSFGGGAFASGTVTVTGSTFDQNSAVGGGAIQGGSAIIVNSTITGNTATSVDPAFSGGAIRTNDDTSLVYATIVGNTAADAANLQVNAALTSFGSVVAEPLGGGVNCVADSATSNGYNFSDDATCGFTGTGDREDAGDPDVRALADNGGPTQTMLPAAASPLLDFIPAASCQDDGASGVTTDQRGVTRPQGGSCDVGAVEVEVPVPPAPFIVLEPTFTG